MFVIMGATGHVGSVVVDTILAQDHAVLGLIHSAEKAAELEAKGAKSAVVDAHDPEALRSAFSRGRRAFLLNPPADPSTDTDKKETATARAILKALEGSNLEKVVAASTMGAVAGEALKPRTGDSSILYEFERGLAAQPIPAAINRGAYYLSNFDLQLDQIRNTGELQTMYPADFRLPMVAPRDLGLVAARRLVSGVEDVGIVSIEAPVRPSWNDVAVAFGKALGRDIRVVTTPREDWIEAFKAQGFSDAAADAYARMTAIALEGPITPQSETEKGETTLDAYVAALVDRQ
jgi:uncharacterized protein YbjT (DUF2867 family)